MKFKFFTTQTSIPRRLLRCCYLHKNPGFQKCLLTLCGVGLSFARFSYSQQQKS